MYTLVLVVSLIGSSAQQQPSITAIPGFSTESECKRAGTGYRVDVLNENFKVVHRCVEVR